MDRRFDWFWVIGWSVLSTVWIVTASADIGTSFDETFYLNAGLSSWRDGSNYPLMRAGTMPLPIDVGYLPLYVWERLRGTPFDLDADHRLLLTYARLGNLWFWWLLLIYGTLLGRLLGGAWAGRTATVLLATEPNFLGHACLATTDIAITALIVVFTYYYHDSREGTRWRRWVWPGILYGLAMTAKASAFTFVPILMLAYELPRWRAQGLFTKPVGVGRWRHLWRITSDFRFHFAKVLAVGTVVLWGYCGCDYKPQPSFVKLANNMTNETWKPTVSWLANNLLIFPNAGEGLVYQIKHNIRGHGAYLLGEWHPRAVRYYFPVAMSIKLTLGLWALFLSLLVWRPRSMSHWLTWAVLLLFVFSSGYRVQIGIRLIFPLLALFYIVIAVGWGRTISAWKPMYRLGWWLVVLALLLYPAWRVWPDGIRYANELWGGPDEVHLHLSDSNSDWGHGVPDLDRWTDDRGLPRAKALYYGSDPTISKDMNRLLPLFLPQYGIEQPEDTLKHVRGHIVAVNLTMLYGDPRRHERLVPVFAFFHGQTPIGRSRSFLIYDFRTK